MRTGAYLVALVVTAAALVRAQSTHSSALGSVAGHVFCSDTRGPARFARVTIETVEDFKASAAPAHRSSSVAVDTKLDGSFVFANVEPGNYYILAEMPGYLSPLAALAPEDIALPSAEDKEKLRAVLQHAELPYQPHPTRLVGFRRRQDPFSSSGRPPFGKTARVLRP